MLVPTTLAVSGIRSSCPRLMTMQCWKSPIPPVLTTRLFQLQFVGGLFGQKEKKHDSAKFPGELTTQRHVKYARCTFSPKSLKFPNSKNIKNTIQNFRNAANALTSMKTHKKKTHEINGETT